METNIPHQADKRFRFSAMTSQEVTLDIFGEIDEWWGYGVPLLAYELSKLNTSQALTVRIHSPGGSVTEGLGIRNLLRAYPGDLTTIGVGFAASIASIILLAGKKVKMADNAYLMIHRPYGGVFGNADEMKRTADTLENMDENLLDIYVDAIQARGKSEAGTREKVWDWMQNETWFTARQAFEHGFIDEVIGAEEMPEENGAVNFQALAKFQHVPRELITQKEEEVSNNLIQKIRALLTDTADATEVEAVKEVQAQEAPAPDPIEEAKKLLKGAGYDVQEAGKQAEESTSEVEEMAELVAQLAAEVKALRTQATAAKATPSGGSTTEEKKPAKNQTARDSAFSGFAEFVKTKIQTR